MSENYIILEGKKIELSKETVKNIMEQIKEKIVDCEDISLEYIGVSDININITDIVLVKDRTSHSRVYINRCFQDGSEFGNNNIFIKCMFGRDCKFGSHCEFSSHCRFGSDCKFELGSMFGKNNVFGSNCTFESYCGFLSCCEFRQDCKFGDHCSFGCRCEFKEGCSFDCLCSFGRRCVFRGGCGVEDSYSTEDQNTKFNINLCGLGRDRI